MIEKKKVKFSKHHQTKTFKSDNNDDNVEESNNATAGAKKSRRFKENHSLDSDEEDVEDSGDGATGSDNLLTEDDIEGQEDETIRHDGEITVTPFNLKDELEEGDYDKDGNYILKKDEEATDQWLESVDWDKAENQFRAKKAEKMTTEEEEEEPLRSVAQVMQVMLTIMKPGEHVLKTLRRLGGNKKPMSSAERWKKKKQKQKEGGGKEEEEVDAKAAEDAANLLELTGLADELLQRGDFQVYEKTYEKLKFEVTNKLSQFDDAEDDEDLSQFDDAEQGGSGSKKARLNGNDGNNDNEDDNEDDSKEGTTSSKMEIEEEEDDDDELEAAFKSSKKNTPTQTQIQTATKRDIHGKQKMRVQESVVQEMKEPCLNVDDEVCWTYRLSEEEGAEEHGPYTSTQMLKMQEDGKFGDSGVFCHKVGSEGSSYNSNRVDFDLYI